MDRIPPFSPQNLEAIAKVLADTTGGLKGDQIGYLLADMRLDDPSQGMTKWKRLFNALAAAQNKHGVGNHTIMFINRAMAPVNFARDHQTFSRLRDELNVVLAFSGFAVGEHGKVTRSKKENTLSGARARASRLRTALEDRSVHPEVLKYCQEQWLQENYFHAVLEATKGIAQRIRDATGLTTDGAELLGAALGVKNPRLAINALSNESELSEQKGFSTLVNGLFGAVRNPLAHAPKTVWPMDEQDALDILTMVSLMHRKLDRANVLRTATDPLRSQRAGRSDVTEAEP